MDITEKYGKTNTVANICKAYGVPPGVGFTMADFLIHGRQNGAWLILALEWFDDRGDNGTGGFGADIRIHRDWMREQWAHDPR